MIKPNNFHGNIYLYNKMENYIQISVVLLKNGLISTYWKSNKYYKIERSKILHKLKINGCAICGYTKCDRALHFHHSNPVDKKFNITIRKIGDKNLIDEVNKCTLLCSNCHMEIEDKEKGEFQ